MKRLKPISSATSSLRRPPAKVHSRSQLRELQRVMASALLRPLTPEWRMQQHWTDGSGMHELAVQFIKANDRLSAFERLELYNRQYGMRKCERCRV